jgi:hypothetical protein
MFNVHGRGIFRHVLVYAKVISTADGSDCREGLVELYHTSRKFWWVLSSANQPTNRSEDVATNGPYRAATGSENADTAGACFLMHDAEPWIITFGDELNPHVALKDGIGIIQHRIDGMHGITIACQLKDRVS